MSARDQEYRISILRAALPPGDPRRESVFTVSASGPGQAAAGALAMAAGKDTDAGLEPADMEYEVESVVCVSSECSPFAKALDELASRLSVK